MDWKHSVRAMTIYNYSQGALSDMRDGLWVGLYPQETMEIVIDQFYLPYDSFFNWTLLLPKFASTNIAQLNLQCKFSIEELFVPSPQTWTSSWYLNAASQFQEDGAKYILNSMSFNLPAALQSRMVRMSISFTLLQADQFTSVVILDGYLTGNENIQRISNVFPSALRARMFSTNMLYYYTNQAFNIGAHHTEDNNVNDIYYSIEDDNDPYANNLGDVVDMWDWQVYANPPTNDSERYIALERWSYIKEENTYAELKELFHSNNNKGTFCEFSEVDTRGLSMAKIKFNEQMMKNLNEPVRYSGFVRLYQVTHATAGTPQTDPSAFALLKTRKVTVLLNPSDWYQPLYRTILKSGPATNDPTYYTTSLSADQINMQYDANVSKLAALTYNLPADQNDLVIADWSYRFPKVGYADPHLYTSNENDRAFYDDLNYCSYYDMISGDSNWQQYGKLDATSLSIKMPKRAQGQTTFSFELNLQNLYNLPGKSPHYAWLDLPFFVDNTSLITKIQIGAGSVAAAPVTLNTLDIVGQNAYLSENELFNVQNVNVEKVSFTIEFNASAPIGYAPNLTILGFGLYSGASVGNIALSFSGRGSENAPTISKPLYPTSFNTAISPKTFAFNLSLTPADASIQLEEIEITTPQRPNCEMEIQSVSVYDVINPSADENLEGKTYYNNIFDSNRNRIQDSFNRLYAPSISTASWTCSSPNRKVEEIMPWVEQHTYDYDADGQFDYAIQYFDGEGKGAATYQPGITYFENAKADAYFYDFNVDGVWDYQEKWDIQTQTYNATPVGSYGTSYYFITQTQTYMHETCQDSNGDGVFNYVEREYAVRSLKVPIPNYREFELDVSGNLHHFTEKLVADNWSTATRGIVQQYDYDDDGGYDYIVQREDRFQNDPQFVQDDNLQKIYETYSIVTRYENGTTTEEKGNTLLQDLTFILIGPDDVSSWTGGQHSSPNNITGQFVVVEHVPVPIDPRQDIVEWKRVANNGVLAWYDSDKDGTYEIAFVFTQQSWTEKIAVAVYLSRSGRQHALTDPAEYSASGDQIVASHWLSDYYQITDIIDVGYAMAYLDFKAYQSSPEFLSNWIIDTAASAAIMFVSALCGPWGLIVAPLLFTAWQYFGRPAVMDVRDQVGLKKVKSHPLGQSGPTDYLSEGARNFIHDYGETWFGGENPTLPVYTQQATFTDVNPFYQDLHKDQFDPKNHYNLTHEDYSVYIGLDRK